jgi:anti-sigma B factor antagonist
LEIDLRKHEDVYVVRLRGALRLGAAVDNLRSSLDQVFQDGGTQIVMNLAEVPMIDSSGIGLLVRLQTTAKLRGGQVKLVSLSAFAAQTLRITGVLGVFDIPADESAAIQSFQ